MVSRLRLLRLALVSGVTAATLATPGFAQPSTDIVVLDLNPHLDHVHVGSMVRVTDRDGYDNQPHFLDHDRLLFVSDREGGRTDIWLHVLSEGRLQRITATPAEAEYSPRLIPGDRLPSGPTLELAAVRVEADGRSQFLVRYAGDLEGGALSALTPMSRGDRLLAPLDDIGYHAWAGPRQVAVFRVGSPSSLHLARVDADGAVEELRLIQEQVGRSLQSVPGTSEVSYVDLSDRDHPVLRRLDAETGEISTVAALPPGVEEHAWLSDRTVFMGHEGILYRSTGDERNPWHPILDLGDVVGSFSRIAVVSGGRRIAVVVDRADPQDDPRAAGESWREPGPGELGGMARVEPQAVGLSGRGLARATEALQAHVEAGDVAGVVAAVARDGRVAYAEALGWRDLEARDPMPQDALFRIYSMTRPVTALAILLLHQEGRLALEDPVQRYLPEFSRQAVLRDPQGTDPSGTRPRVGDVTLAHLLLHTSGIGSRSSSLYRAHGVHGWDQPLEQVVRNVAALPLFEDPGTAFRYGMHSEVLGRVVEVVSGMPLEAFLRQRIFGPLGMNDTVFEVDPTRRSRLATLYRRGPGGELEPHEMETIPVTDPRALTSAGVGLVTTAGDFLAFAQALLDGGPTSPLDGSPLFSPETLAMARANAVSPDLLPLLPRGYWAGSGWSLGGMAVVLDPSAYSHPVHPEEFWWDGSAGTRFWIDPEENLIILVMAQVSPAGGNGFREGFRGFVDAAVEERRRR